MRAVFSLIPVSSIAFLTRSSFKIIVVLMHILYCFNMHWSIDRVIFAHIRLEL